MMMERYNESADTFSFSLVLLSLAAGDISYVRKRGKSIASTSYAMGWRPPIPSKLRKRCPELASLIKEMWDGDLRARPTMKEVVIRLEVCLSVDGVANDTIDDLDQNGDDIVEVILETLQPADVAAIRAEIKAIRAEKESDRHQIAQLKSEKESDRHQIAKLKSAFLAGTGMEGANDEVGILGGMFICKSRVVTSLGHICSCSLSKSHSE